MNIGYILAVSITISTPLLLAALGEIFAERSGVLNLGIEGLMMFGGAVGFVVSYITNNPYVGILVAGILTSILSLLHAFVSVTLRGNQIISGLALTMIGVGLGALVGMDYVGKVLRVRIYPVPIPYLSRIPLLGAFFQQDPIVYLSYIFVVLSWFVLYRTRWGLIIRATGENPAAVDAMGIDVDFVRYVCVAIGGFFAGIGGAYITVVYFGSWNELLTEGKGWIALAIVIVSLWNPLILFVVAYGFGFTMILALWLQSYGYNQYLLNTIPYITTIIMLILIQPLKKKIGVPRAIGKPYIREDEALYGTP